MRYTLINALDVDCKTQAHKDLYNVDFVVSTFKEGEQLQLTFIDKTIEYGEIIRVFDIENLGVLEITTDKGLYYLSKS